MDNDTQQVQKYRNNFSNTTVFTSKDCEMNTINHVISSRGLSHVHFMYHVNDYVAVDQMISYQENLLYKCQISILQALTQTFKHRCSVYFHIKIPHRPGYSKPRSKTERHTARTCAIDAYLKADSQIYNIFRILEMNLAVFHRLYNFSYYYVI
jgi:hypothetical protein